MNWEAVADATSYDVYVGGELVGNQAETSFTLPLDETGAEKAAYVIAKNAEAASAKSNEVKLSFSVDESTKWGYLSFSDQNPPIEFTNWSIVGTHESADNGVHIKGVGSMRNLVSVKDSSKCLYVVAGAYDATTAPTIIVTFKSNIVKACGYETDGVQLATGVRTVFGYHYDLSAYVGQTGVLTVKQVTEGSDDCLVNKIEMMEFDAGADAETSAYTEWLERDDIIADWPIAGNYRDGVGEGYDINSYDNEVVSSISKYVAIGADTPIMKIRTRMFKGQDGSDEEASGYRSSILGVRVNGVEVLPMGYTSSAKVRSDTDAPYIFFYDMTAYAGKSVNIYISNDAYQTTGHMVVQGIKFQESNINSEVAANYDGQKLKDEWVTVGDTDVEDGTLKVSSWNTVSSISKVAAITADNAKMEVTYAPHLCDSDLEGHDGTSNFDVKINYSRIKAVGDEGYYVNVAIDGTEDVVKHYDLAEFIGKSVFITITQNNDWNDHSVIKSVKFAA